LLDHRTVEPGISIYKKQPATDFKKKQDLTPCLAQAQIALLHGSDRRWPALSVQARRLVINADLPDLYRFF
jgi:hypothetical protein